MDFLDNLGDLASFFIFVAIIILGNIFDKKKPKVKSKPFPKGQKLPDIKRMPTVSLPDIKPPAQEKEDIKVPVEVVTEPEHRPHHPAEYEEVHNPYQRYLERNVSEEAVPEADTPKPVRQQAAEAKPVPAAFAGIAHLSLLQAITAAEILDKPKALQKRRRWR